MNTIRYFVLGSTLFFFLMTFSPGPSNAQIDEGTFMAHARMDVYRFDNPGLFQRFGAAIGLNYFPVDKLSFGADAEIMAHVNGGTATYWSTSLRYYLVGKAFLRMNTRTRGFFNYFELMMGAGYDFMLSDHWALEINGDYYMLRQRTLGCRAGINWFL